jgi:hypothetical protein
MAQAKKARTTKAAVKKPSKAKYPVKKPIVKKRVTKKPTGLAHRLLVAAKLKKPTGRKVGTSAGFIAVPKTTSNRIVLAAIIIAFAGTASYFTFFSSAAVVTLAKVEAEKMTIQTNSNRAPYWVALWSNGVANGSFTTTAAADKITIRAKGDQCGGAPQMVLKVNGQQIYSAAVTAASFTDYTTAVSLPAGTHTLQLAFINDNWLPGTCDRNLYIDRTTVYGTTTIQTPAPTVTLTANPTSIASGATSNLTWSSTNATSCTASGAWSGSKATSGTAATAALTANASYSLSCSGSGGSASASANVTVTAAPSTSRPSAAITGVPAGKTLRVVNGDVTVSTANTIIDGQDIHGFVRVTAPGVIIRNSIIRGPDTLASSYRGQLLTVTGTGVRAIVEDSEIRATVPTVGLDCANVSNFVGRRLDVSNCTDGFKARSNVRIEYSYIHNLKWWAADPAQGGAETHGDGVQVYWGSGAINDVVLDHNSFELTLNENAGVQMTEEGGAVTGLSITNNYFNGGKAVLNISNKGTGAATTVNIASNRFGRISTTPIVHSSNITLTGSGNVYDDNNQPVPVR